MTIPEGRAPMTDKDLADLTRRLAETAIERNCRCEELEAENKRLREAVTPSADTKAAYMGEFTVPVPYVDEFGDEVMGRINVPWTTIKEIMAAIRARAALETKGKRHE